MFPCPRGLKPWVLVRGVVDDQIDNHPHPTVFCGLDELDEIPQRPQGGVDAVVVGDVVAIVLAR